jgi:hypothetical protein
MGTANSPWTPSGTTRPLTVWPTSCDPISKASPHDSKPAGFCAGPSEAAFRRNEARFQSDTHALWSGATTVPHVSVSVCIDIQAKLNGARIALQVDIGFGDAVTPAPQTISYPVLLNDFPASQLRAYPKYTVVAEKFHAVGPLGMTNTRTKDYFDL